MASLRNFGALVARIAMAYIFLAGGIEKFQSPGGTAEYMAQAGHIPHPAVMPLLYLSAVIELVGGILLILGIAPRIVAFIIFLWLIPVTLDIHVLNHQAIEWHKNLAILGGLLMITVYGAGDWVLFGRRRTAPTSIRAKAA
ncbi:MAG: DoxX family protein [Candidatus Binataceae bacterium]